MRFGFFSAFKTFCITWIAALSVRGKYRPVFLSKPLDATRYLEFGYILEFLKRNHLKAGKVLDVSSPVMISYILSRQGHTVIKTDINANEAKYVKNSPRLSFSVQNAVSLSYDEGIFDMVVSISVIEHIYRRFQEAISEMVRVTRPGGYVYLTFPVAWESMEEWLDEDPYGSQKRVSEKVFFQYRFGPGQYQSLMDNLPEEVEVVCADIFWERKKGSYDSLVRKLRAPSCGRIHSHLRATFWNLFLGPFFFEAEPGPFEEGRVFGNAQWVLKVKKGPELR